MSTLKVDTVRPVTTDGSLSLKGDSGGSATTNGILVDSSGNTSVSGQLNADNIRLDGNTISSTDTDGDITLDPNGAGIVSLDGAVTINESGADVDFRVESDTNTHALFVDGSNSAVLMGTTNLALYSATSGNGLVVNDGSLGVAKNGKVAYFNRMGTDGTIIEFFQAGVVEGTISVSGIDVTLNGATLSRWAQLPDDSRDETIVKGTVMTNLDDLCEWSHPDEYWTEDDEIPVDEEGNPVAAVGDLKRAAFLEDNGQLNRMVVSSVEGDPNVAGVFVNWDNDDDQFNDMIVAMTGDLVIRIAQGTTVQRGDLLMSAGDGTAKPQGDDIVRSKTIAKVTSTHVSHTYDDGTYLVPCVLMAC